MRQRRESCLLMRESVDPIRQLEKTQKLSDGNRKNDLKPMLEALKDY